MSNPPAPEKISKDRVTRTPLSLITGALGSGKTTLLMRILEKTDRKIAVLMNEFGEIGIDGTVIEGENVDIVELAGGCVCCSLTGEFEAAISEIIALAAPEFIVVEATGVAESDALVFEVEDNIPIVRLDSVIFIVDAFATIKYPALGYTARTQLQAADIVLVNKIDLVNAAELDTVLGDIRAHNERANIFKAVKCDVDINLLFGLGVKQRETVPVQAGTSHFTSFVFTSEKIIDPNKFEELVSGLPPTIYRAKGFVCFPHGSFLFNYVVGRKDFDPFPSDTTRLVFIGEELAAARDDIIRGLEECEV